MAASVPAIAISHEFPDCTRKSVSYCARLLAVPVAVVDITRAEPVITASPSCIAFPEILTIGTVSSDPSAVTAIATCFMLLTLVGTVKLLDLSLETARDARRQGNLMIAKMAVGSDYLRSESAVEIKLS